MQKKVGGIAVHDDGLRGGLPVIFIHGFPFNHTFWKFQIQALAKTYRVISYDVRGHGQSDVGDGQYTFELFVDDLIRVMDYLKIQRGVLCGLSMGGYIALRAVERHADRFSGLVLCDTKTQMDDNRVKIKRATMIRAVKENGVEVFAKEFVKTLLSRKNLATKPSLVQFVLNLIQGNSALGISGTLLALAGRTDTTASLTKMTLPALILVGEEDRLTPPSDSELMLKALPNAVMHLIPHAGHLPNLENPVTFNKTLQGFLKKIS